MVELDVDIAVGGVLPLTVLSTTTAVTPITGGGVLAGWSLRDALADVPVEADGNVVAPAAGATIVSIAGVAAGTYTLKWSVGLQGPAAAADANNFQVFVNAVATDASLNPGVAGDYPQADAVLVIPAGATVAVKAIGAGTAGVTYSAQISLEPNGIIETIVELTSGGDILGEISVADTGSASRWFGSGGPRFVNGVTLTVLAGAVRGVIYVVPNYP
jgi:hypothetical protein